MVRDVSELPCKELNDTRARHDANRAAALSSSIRARMNTRIVVWTFDKMGMIAFMVEGTHY